MNHRFSEETLNNIVEEKEVALRTQVALRRPKKYKVILLNDDYTPMEFVVAVVMQFFQKSKETATQLMLQVHLQGKAICGVFTRDIAETKLSLVNDCARLNEHPLLCIMEPEDE